MSYSPCYAALQDYGTAECTHYSLRLLSPRVSMSRRAQGSRTMLMARHLMSSLLSGLHWLHQELGYVHTDVKPDVINPKPILGRRLSPSAPPLSLLG